MERDKKELLVLIVIIFLGLNYAFYEYYFIPKKISLESKKQSYKEKEGRLNYLKEQQKNIDVINKEIESLTKETEKLDSKINTPQLVYDFYNVCKNYNVKGENVSFTLPEETSEQMQTFLISLSVSGTSGNVESFIKDIEGSTNNKMNVKSVTLSSMESSEGGSSAEIVLYQYVNNR